jgi:hypothetical protein
MHNKMRFGVSSFLGWFELIFRAVFKVILGVISCPNVLLNYYISLHFTSI